MADRAAKDWTKTGTIAGYAEYLRKNADAFAVIVVRRDDAVLAADGLIKPADLGERILDDVPALMADLKKAREEKRAARVQWGELGE